MYQHQSVLLKKIFVLISASLFVCTLFLSSAEKIRAQDDPNAPQNSDVTLTVSPENPYPFENVSATLSSYTLNLDTASIGWYINGKVQNAGTGKKQFSFITGASGTSTVLYAKIILADKTILEQQITLQTGTVAILWEATNSYTPPFYKGKALPSPEATIKVVAIPESLGDTNYVYTWSKNFNGIGTASGYNKNSYTFKNNYLDKEESISVTARGNTKKVSGQGAITISFVNPNILFYEDNPLTGPLYNTQLIGDLSLLKDEMTLLAEPYFFSIGKSTDTDLTYTWTLNDGPIDTPDPKNELVIRKNGDGNGTSIIKLAIESAQKIFGIGQNKVTIHF